MKHIELGGYFFIVSETAKIKPNDWVYDPQGEFVLSTDYVHKMEGVKKILFSDSPKVIEGINKQKKAEIIELVREYHLYASTFGQKTISFTEWLDKIKQYEKYSI